MKQFKAGSVVNLAVMCYTRGLRDLPFHNVKSLTLDRLQNTDFKYLRNAKNLERLRIEDCFDSEDDDYFVI